MPHVAYEHLHKAAESARVINSDKRSLFCTSYRSRYQFRRSYLLFGFPCLCLVMNAKYQFD